MKMKKTGTLILTAAVAASIFAGCSQPTEETTVNVSDPTALTTAPVETAPSETAPAETEPEIPESMEDVYGNQITNYLNHQYYFNGEPVPMWESNYYFMETFNVLGESAGYNGAPLTTYGFVDLAAEYPGEEFATYGDFLVRQAEETIQSKCILCMRAEAEGITLSDESYAQIDKLVEDYRNYVAQLNITLEDYLKISLGPDIDEAAFKKIWEVDYLSNEYANHYCSNYDATLPQIRYVFFPATEADEQEIRDAASDAASQLKDACENDIEKLPTLAEEAKAAGTNLDYGDLSIPLEQFPINLEEWAWSESRSAGDIDIVVEPDLGYFVVGYLGTTPDREKATEALIGEIRADIEANTYDFHTDEPFGAAPAAPTATPVPETSQTEPSAQVSFDPNATSPTTPSGSAAPLSNAKTNDVIAVVLYTLAGVAIAAVVVLLIAAAVKKSKNAPDKSEAFDDEEDDDEESETDASESDEDEEDDEDDGE